MYHYIQAINQVFLTTDKEVQEDAIEIHFDGTALGKFGFTSNFTEDLRALKEAESAVSFSINVSEKPIAPFLAKMSCESGCEGSIKLNDLLIVDQQWHSLSIDLQCFEQAGADLSKVTSILSFESSVPYTMIIADVVIIPNMAKKSDITCH